jgi:hypothetical protein
VPDGFPPFDYSQQILPEKGAAEKFKHSDIMSSMAHEIIEKLLAGIGGKFSRELGIDLSGADPAKIFRWILAAKLFVTGFLQGERCRQETMRRGETKW